MDDDATDSEAPVVPETPGGRPATVRSLRHMTTTTSIVQVRADPQMHGRVLALQTVLLIGTTPIGAPLLGALADAAGPRSIVVVVMWRRRARPGRGVRRVRRASHPGARERLSRRDGVTAPPERGDYSPVPVPSRPSGTAASTAAGSASSAGAAVAVELASHSARSTSSASLE